LEMDGQKKSVGEKFQVGRAGNDAMMRLDLLPKRSERGGNEKRKFFSRLFLVWGGWRHRAQPPAQGPTTSGEESGGTRSARGPWGHEGGGGKTRRPGGWDGKPRGKLAGAS